MASPTSLLLFFLIASSAASAVRIGPDLPILRGIADVTPRILRLPSENVMRAAEECEQTYGFLPCTMTVVGNLFLLVVYGFFMFQAAKFLSTGSEMMLEILGPGIVGGLFLPILGALPDAILILMSGLSGSKETAQEQVLIGMGLLAGSTVMLLTTLWGSCVIVGKCDLSENSVSIDSQDTKVFSLTGSGISTDIETSHAAKIMTISVIPFIIAQLPTILKSHAEDRLAVLVAFIAAVLFLLSYCIYQIYQPWIQKRRLAYAKYKHVISGILRHVHQQSLGRLLDTNGTPNQNVIEKLFERIDANNDGYVTADELRALIVGIHFEEFNLDEYDAVQKVMEDFDTTRDNRIDRAEFITGMSQWLRLAKTAVPHSGAYSKFVHDFHNTTREEHAQLMEGSDESENDVVVETVDNPAWTCFKAVLFMLLGTGIALVFADPLVDAVSNFSTATRIPSFFISFIAMPFATNSSEAVSAIIFASRKKQRTSSLTFSEIYGGVTMNNTLCLAVFLALVYTRGLTWDFSSEVLIILIVCIVMGLFTSFHTTFPLWTCFVAYLLYPLSLALVYVLDFVFGWS